MSTSSEFAPRQQDDENGPQHERPFGPGAPLAIAANVTVTAPTGTGYITVYPDEVVRPLTSVLAFDPGQTIPNGTTIGVGRDGGDAPCNGSNGTVQLIADVFGFYI